MPRRICVAITTARRLQRAGLAELVADTSRLCAAIILALECAPPRTRVHLFGFQLHKSKNP